MYFRRFVWNINLLNSHKLKRERNNTFWPQLTTFIDYYDFSFVDESEVAINSRVNPFRDVNGFSDSSLLTAL